tara:strand:+ start:576 stop:890 length:315 start_codon:yes stop_codon:yes gene_type:complete
MADFVIITQVLENYGGYWKFKWGNHFVVSDCPRRQDAVAFVFEQFSKNTDYQKEFPSEVYSYDNWEKELLKEDKDYIELIKSNVRQVSPKTGRMVIMPNIVKEA